MTRRVVLELLAKNRAKGELAAFNRGIGTTGRAVKRLAGSMMAMAGVGGGMYMLSSVMRSGVREAAAFEKQMAMVSTMLNDQSMSIMPRYVQQMRTMSQQFGEGTETLSKGLYDILSASIAPANALNVLAVSAKAAKAGITDTGIAADAITTILNSYSLGAERAGDVSDKLFAIVQRGKTTFADLAPNIGKIAALAATAGLSFDDMGATLATMTRAGVQTEIAITSLRAIMLSFLKPQADSIDMARQYGVELNSNTLRTIGLTGVIEKLKKATAEELAVIVPTSRAITGFAAAIQKADALAGDYDYMLNSLGETEKAYQKIADTSAFKLDQLNQEWIDLKRVIGDLTTGPLIGFLGAVKRHLEDWSRFVRETKEGLIDIAQLLHLMERPIEFGGGGGGQFRGYGATGGWESPTGESSAGAPIKAPASSAGAAAPSSTDLAKANARILADTREKLASIRSMDYMTRMEKIQNLKAYMEAHSATLDQVEGAEKLLNDELIALQNSRLDAMKVYQAELREDMQNTSLYTSEKFAEAAREIEWSMSGAFQSMITDGASWRDAMNQFFTDVAASFAKMAADMAARAAMAGIMNIFAGSGSMITAGGSAAGGGNPYFLHSGGIAGVNGVRKPVPFGTFIGAPRLHDGLRSDERAVIMQTGEEVIPRGGRGGGGQTIIIEGDYIEKVDAIDTQSFQQALGKERSFLSDLNVVSRKSNHRSRRIR